MGEGPMPGRYVAVHVAAAALAARAAAAWRAAPPRSTVNEKAPKLAANRHGAGARTLPKLAVQVPA